MIRRSFECGSLRPWGPRRAGTASILLPPAIAGMYVLRAMLCVSPVAAHDCSTSCWHCFFFRAPHSATMYSNHEEKGICANVFVVREDGRFTIRHHVQTLMQSDLICPFIAKQEGCYSIDRNREYSRLGLGTHSAPSAADSKRRALVHRLPCSNRAQVDCIIQMN